MPCFNKNFEDILNEETWVLKKLDSESEKQSSSKDSLEKNEEKKEEKMEEKEEKKDEIFDFKKNGFEENDVLRFGIDLDEFQGMNNEEKLEILKEKKEFLEVKQKLEFMYLRESGMLKASVAKQRSAVVGEEFREYLQSARFEELLKNHFQGESRK